MSELKLRPPNENYLFSEVVSRQNPLRVAVFYPEALMESERWRRRTIRPGTLGSQVKASPPCRLFLVVIAQ